MEIPKIRLNDAGKRVNGVEFMEVLSDKVYKTHAITINDEAVIMNECGVFQYIQRQYYDLVTERKTRMSNFDKLPKYCFQRLLTDGRLIKITRGESGYEPYNRFGDAVFVTTEEVKQLNYEFGITPAQSEAMLVGSMFGWDVPGADPDIYWEDGTFKVFYVL